MISNCLDHIVILVPELDGASRNYERLLGRTADWQHSSQEDGTATSIFRLSNTAIELMAPAGDGPIGKRIRELLGEREGKLSSLVFGTPDINDAHYYLHRRGMRPGDVIRQAATNMGQTRQWARFKCDAPDAGDVKLFLIQQEQGSLPYMGAAKSAASRLDHVVVNSGNPHRAMATYGARLGLDLALDRTNEKWGARFLFFRTDDLTVEVVQRLDGSMAAEDPDYLWGMTFEMSDLDAAHERLTGLGVSVGEVRPGRKAGTRVMRVSSHCLGIPTLLLDNRG